MRSAPLRTLTLLAILFAPVALHAQTTWTGAVSTSWDTAGNWSPAAVPGAGTDVIIASAANQPSSYLVNPACASLEIEPGASMTLGGGFDLSVSGALTVDGSLTVAAATSSVTVGGDLVIDGTFTARGGSVELTGTGDLGGTGTTTFFNLTVSGGTRTCTGAVTISGDMVVEGTATLDLGAFTHSCAGNWTSSAVGAAVTGTGGVDFTGDGLLTTVSNSIPNMSVSGGVRSINPSEVTGDLGMTAGEIVILDNVTLTVGGNATLLGGTLGWTGGFAGLEVLDVAGDVTLTAAAGTTSADSRLRCAGNWSSTSAFAPGAGWVELDGAGATTVGGASPTFANLRMTGGTKSLLSAAAVTGDLDISTGTTFDTSAAVDVDGSVTLADVSSTWALGASTHTVAGDWTSSGGSATGAGTVDFDGTGTLSTSTGSIANALVSLGTRTVMDSDVTGDLSMSGGVLDIQDDQTVTVGGNLSLTAGMLSLTPGSPLLETLDVEGDVTITATSGTFGPGARVRCAGSWSSGAAFTPADGTVILDGGTVVTVGGSGTTFPNLNIASGTKTVTSTVTVNGDLTVSSGATLDADAALDVNGDVSLGDGTANWDLGASTHTVSGDWLSSGASATGSGVVHFDGSGSVTGGGGIIANVATSTGTREFNATVIVGDLDQTGGVLSIADNQVITVLGNAALSVGTLDFVDSTVGFEVLDVAGNVSIDVTAGTMNANSRIGCGGDWTSSSSWLPTAGLVSLDGSSPSTISGVGTTFADLAILNSTRTLLAAASVENLAIFSSGGLTASAVLDVNAGVILGTVTSTWDMGTLTHTVAGDWTSSGGSATNGTIEFDGASGSLATGAGSIADVTITDARSVSDSSVTGDLSLVSPGSITIEADQTLSVGGNATLTADTLSFAAGPNGTPELLDVEGNVTLTAALGTVTTDSEIHCGGDWSSTGFAPGAGRVLLDGVGATIVSGTGLGFFDLDLENGARTVTSAAAIGGSLSIASGASMTTSAVLDIEGNVTLGDGTSSWDMGTLEHTVAGDWTSTGGSATNGTIAFDGVGSLSSANGTIAGVKTHNTRQVFDSIVTGDFELISPGALTIEADQTLTVGGNALLTADTLSFAAGPNGTPELIDVAGDVTITAASGTVTTDSRIDCAGNWTSSAAFAPGAGLVVLDGVAPTTVDAITLPDVDVTGSTKTVLTGSSMLSLDVADNTILVTSAALDVNGPVTIGTGTAEWQLGAFTHTVAGDWTSTGGSATGAGTVEFDAGGALATGAASIANVLISAGARSASTSLVAGNLDMTAGTLAIGNDETLTVNGDCALTGGQISWTLFAGGTFDMLDVDGNVTMEVPVGGENTDSRIRCGGDWLASSAFQPVLGSVVLDTAAAATVDGTGAPPSIYFGDLIVTGAPKTVLDDVEVAGELRVSSSGSLALGGTTATVQADFVTVQGSLDLGTATVEVVGDWTSSAGGATVSGSGTVELTGLGTLATGANTVPNVLISSGDRTATTSAVAGTLQMTAGGLTISDNQTLSVGGDSTLSAGTLDFDDTSAGLETLDVEGNVSLDASSGTTSSNTRVLCAGDWSSSGPWSPASGLVVLDGLAPTSISGAGITFPDLRITGSTRTLLAPAVASNLEIVSGAGLVTSAVLDVDGAVVLGDGTSSWDMGTLTHTVGGDWTSAGGSAGNGTVSFDGGGSLDTGGGSIANAEMTSGARDVVTSSIIGDLSLTGGTLTIQDDETLSVGGDASLTAGTLAFWPVASGGDEVLDVEGSVVCTATAGTTTTSSVIRCAGDWTSDASFAPGAGFVELDGVAASLLSGNGPGFDPSFAKLRIMNGLRSAGNDFTLTATNVEIHANATLETGSQTLTLPASAVEVQLDGTLDVQAGGTLALGGASVLSVLTGGNLSLVGSAADPASIVGSGGGGYLVNVEGNLAASNFLVSEPGASGFVVGSAATIAAAPDDLRGGTFTSPSAAGGSVLLDIRRSSPTEFRYVDFEDPGTVGTYNVRTLSGSVITFTNSDGGFSGSAFEHDPFRLIEWADDATTLTSFVATPGADVVDLEWTSSIEADIDMWIVQRATSASGPFTDLIEVTPVGPSTYMFSDTTVTPLQLYHYNIAQRLTHGEVEVLDTRVTKPWSSAAPPNFFTVGASGTYADVGAAIAALSGVNPVISVEGGTYPAFSIGPGITGTVRILADGSGPVVIDTTAAPVTIMDLPALGSIEMSDLEIGDGASPNAGLEVVDCLGVIVLDESVVHGGVGMPGVHISNSNKVAIQRTDMDGVPGLLVDTGSVAIASKGMLDDIELKDSSFVRLCEMPTTSTVEAGSTLTELGGVMSDIDAPEFVELGGPFTLTMSGTPNGSWFLSVSLGLGWHDFTGELWEMVGVASLPLNVLFVQGPLGPTGTLAIPSSMPGSALLYGFPIVLQSVVVHPSTSVRRWSNVISIIGIG